MISSNWFANAVRDPAWQFVGVVVACITIVAPMAFAFYKSSMPLKQKISAIAMLTLTVVFIFSLVFVWVSHLPADGSSITAGHTSTASASGSGAPTASPLLRSPTSVHSGPSNEPTAAGITPTATAVILVVPTPTPTPTIVPTTAVSSSGFFDFETGSESWGTSEGSYKLAQVSSTNKQYYAGTHSLEVDTALLGNGNPAYNSSKEVYRHTEAIGYFSQAIPEGFKTAGPYNLAGKEISCYVLLPASLVVDGNPQVYIRLFVKDQNFANDFSKPVDVDVNHTGNWFKLSFVVGADPGDADTGFDATKVMAVGVRVDTLDGATLSFNSSYYIDHVVIPHP